MKNHGHEVAGFSRKHPLDIAAEFGAYFPPDIVTNKISLSWEAVKSIKQIFYSLSARDSLDKIISEFKPDIAHVHNIYGRLTTSVLDLLTQRKVPAVMTLHDYKLVCPSYKFMHGNRICEDCKGARYYMAIKNRCHKDSYPASSIIAMESYFNEWFNKYRKNVHFFISPSHFLMNKFVAFGWPEKQMKYVPNFLNLSKFNPNYTPGNYFLYLGRLSQEKGTETLIQAFSQLKNLKVELLVVGDGPLQKELKEKTRAINNIRFAGYLSGTALLDATRNALAVIVPSEWYENAPISILEALAYGKPVIGAKIGGIPEMIQDGVNGILYESGNRDALKNALDCLANMDSSEIENMGRAARRKVESENSIESHYLHLMEIYQEVLERSKG